MKKSDLFRMMRGGGIFAPPGDDLTPVSFSNTFSMGAATFTFDQPVYHGTTAEGIPFVVSDREFTLIADTPTSVQLPTDSIYTDVNLGSRPLGDPIWAYGAEINTYIPVYPIGQYAEYDGQGFDEMWARWRNDGGGKHPMGYGGMEYNHARNKSVGAAGPLTINLGDNFAFTKSIRKAGLLTPYIRSEPLGTWRLYDEWVGFNVFSEIPPAGAFAPGTAALDKLNWVTEDMIRWEVFPESLAMPVGWPSLASLEAAHNFDRTIQPFFGQMGEFLRPSMINMSYAGSGGTLGENSAYSRDWSQKWSQWIQTLFAQGREACQTTYRPLVCRAIGVGLQLMSLAERGHQGLAGAGQGSGHKQLMHLVSHLFLNDRPEFFGLTQGFAGNCTHLQFYVQPSMVGMFTYDYTYNHSVNHGTFQPESVGQASWVHTRRSVPEAPSNPNHDANDDADYQMNSAGIAEFPELNTIMLYRAGPLGRDGITALSEGDFASDVGASGAYWDTYRTFVSGSTTPYASGSSIIGQAQQDLYDLHRDTLVSLPRHEFRPRAATVSLSKQAGFLTAGANSFTWNTAGLGSANPAAEEAQIEYSTDGYQFKSVSAALPRLSGTQNGLLAGVDYKIRWARANTIGGIKDYGPWSINYKRVETEPTGQMIVRPTGSNAGTVTNTAQPKIYINKFPEHWAIFPEEAPSVIDIEEIYTLYCGDGEWSGAVPVVSGVLQTTFQWKKNGVNVAGATSRAWPFTGADLNTAAVVCDVTCGGVTVTSAAVSLPARPSQPAGLIIEDDFHNASFPVLYPLAWASLQANQVNGTMTVSPSKVVSKVSGEDTTEVFAQGVLWAKKTGSHPKMRGNLAADFPMTIGQTYRFQGEVILEANGSSPTQSTSFRAGSTLDASNYIPITTYTPVDGAVTPEKHVVDVTFVATSTSFWIGIWTTSSTGGVSGRSPMFDSFSLEQV